MRPVRSSSRRDLRARAPAISRVLAIVAELQNTLDLENGGYITSRLLDVAVKNDVTAIDEARRLLTPIRDAWSQISTQSSVALRQDSGQAVGAP